MNPAAGRGARASAILLIASALLLCPVAARAGGLARPNPISARGIGMGGAFVAVADDPTALHFNPAGIALQTRSTILIGAELVFAPRTFTPTWADSRCDGEEQPENCQEQSPETSPAIVPSLGYVHRLSKEGVPSRLSFGVGLWNTYGGALEYEKFEDDRLAAINETQNAVLELVPGIAYEVNEVLAVGFALRIGIGLFKLDATAKPVSSTLSGEGVGVGATFGAMVRPSDSVQLGLVYRTALTNEVTGGGELETAPEPVDLRIAQTWPQSAGLGLAWRLRQRILLAAQLDWTNWQRINEFVLEFPGKEELNQTVYFDWNDSFAAHLGAEIAATGALDLRLGLSYDTRAIPFYTMERAYLDGDKLTFNAGASVSVTDNWRLDMAIELIPGSPHTIEDNSAQLRDWRNHAGTTPATRANAAPGEHHGSIYTFELAVQYQL